MTKIGKKKNEKIFLDTSALIPLLEREHSNHGRVVSFLSDTTSLYVDTVVLAEFLSPYANDPALEDTALRAISSQFRICSLSPYGSTIAARIYDAARKAGQLPRRQPDEILMKADILIMACAIEQKVDIVLAADGHFSSLAACCDFSGASRPEFMNISEIHYTPDLF